MKRAATLAAALLLIIILAPPANAGGARDFSFLAFGDCMTHYYLPGGAADQKNLMAVFPADKPYQEVRFHFDPVSGELAWARIKPRGRRPAMTITYHQGWPQVLREEVEGVERIVLRDAGRRWVFDMVASQIRSAAASGSGPGFALQLGDAVVWGGQGNTLATSPYWQRFKVELLDRLPPATTELGLPCRVLMTLGNHDLYSDPQIKGVTTTLPCLKKLGFGPSRRIYSFAHRGSRFIVLNTSRYKNGTWWNDPPKDQQFAQLEKWLDLAVAQGASQVFVAFHVAAFCVGGRGGMPTAQSPHPILKRYADRLSVTVLNGHVHTTEAFVKDKVRYLVLGGAGSPQKLAHKTPPPGYPQELYWKGAPRVEEYNYAILSVTGAGLEVKVHRFRPGRPQRPFEMVTVFKP